MSTTQHVVVWCDIKSPASCTRARCLRMHHRGRSRAGTMAAARRDAAQRGWVHIGETDICPICLPTSADLLNALGLEQVGWYSVEDNETLDISELDDRALGRPARWPWYVPIYRSTEVDG